MTIPGPTYEGVSWLGAGAAVPGDGAVGPEKVLGRLRQADGGDVVRAVTIVDILEKEAGS